MSDLVSHTQKTTQPDQTAATKASKWQATSTAQTVSSSCSHKSFVTFCYAGIWKFVCQMSFSAKENKM
jgi:hypothetical protein